MKNKTIKRMWEMLKPKKKSLIIISILAIIINLIEVAKPYLVKVVIDDYLSIKTWKIGLISIGVIGAVYIALVFIGYILNFIVSTSTSMVGENVVYILRNKLFKYVQNANMKFHDKTPSGTIFVRLTSDVEDIITFFKEVVSTFVKDVVLIIALMVMMLSLNYKLALVSFIMVPFIILTSVVITKMSKKIRDKSKKEKTKLNIFLAESIYGIKLIKLFNRQYEKEKECAKVSNAFYKSRVPIAYTSGFLIAFMVLFENLGISLIVWFCINNFFKVNANVGLIYMFITYLKQIFDPIQRIVENFETIQEAFVSVNKIYDIMDHTEYLEDFESGIKPEEIKGKIEFKNVWFAYEGENWILKDISFTIEPGQSIALVGRTGSGKTTIINLINRFYDIQKGEILLDGINIKDINLRYLRRKVGIILQDPFIFAKTIKENIELNENLTDEATMEAIRLASTEEFVESLPNGLEEVAHERGSSFSTGQKQLLVFARIFAHNPSIFILDEATSNIDTKTEELIQKSVDKISKDKTSIFIAHRLSTIINVDKIIVLSNGEILEQGSHNELLSKPDGYYSKLYNAYYQSLTA